MIYIHTTRAQASTASVLSRPLMDPPWKGGKQEDEWAERRMPTFPLRDWGSKRTARTEEPLGGGRVSLSAAHNLSMGGLGLTLCFLK